jgi:CHASE3 domain sensor protein
MWTFGRKIAAAFALSFVLLLGVGGVAYRNLTTLSTTSLAVDRAHAIVEGLTELLTQAKDAETGQRGFVITGGLPRAVPVCSRSARAGPATAS